MWVNYMLHDFDFQSAWESNQVTWIWPVFVATVVLNVYIYPWRKKEVNNSMCQTKVRCFSLLLTPNE